VSDQYSLESLSAEDFRVHVGSGFRLSGASREAGAAVSLELELAAVSKPAVGAAAAFRAPFSLVFHGPLTPVMPQAIYPLTHDKLGLLELFMVPIGPAAPAASEQSPTAMRYEVVFG
jgi:hypothetical protein